jgi:hypothetical protein
VTTFFSLPDSGSTTFGSWSFSWTIHGHDEGLVLRDVRWKNTQVLYKASLPVIRVKYRGGGQDIRDGCGPFADQIGGVKTDELPGVDSDVASRIFDGELFEIAVYDEIGGYDLYHAWTFHTSGWMMGLLASRGWSCGESPPIRRNHRHHPYWRLDFDVESISNEVHTFRTLQTGASLWTKRTQEGQASRPSADRLLGVRVTSTSSSKHVTAYIYGNGLPDAGGSPWFNFSNKDIAWRRYRASDDNGWRFGSLGHLGLASPVENIDHQDVVIWMVGHLDHSWDGHDPAGLELHWIGPIIRPSW